MAFESKKTVLLAAAGLLILLAGSCTQKSKEITLQVKTASGIIEGKEEDGVKMFLGVPFAEAPVGELRWQAPQPKAAWEGVLPTKEFSYDPMQPDIYGDMSFRGKGRSEDCLYLNIWTTAKTEADGMPVLIYFNGGGLMAGSGSEPRYDGGAISKEGVIGVTANYREGIFGFFSHPDLTAASPYKGSGNYGFLDQAAAIQWVKDNIKAFGGSPDRITIVGESAGSFSVSLLMCSPLSKNIIAGAMLSSGAEVMPYKAFLQADADADGAALLESKGVSFAEAAVMDADTLQKLFPPRSMKNVILDGHFMTESADEVFAKGEQAQVPLLAGWNSLEGSPQQALRGKEATLANYREAMRATFGESTDEIFEAYGLLSDEDVMSQKGLDLASDLFTGFPTWKVCDYHARTSDQPVFRYKYMHARPQVSSRMGDKVAALAGGVREKTDAEKEEEAKKPAGPVGAVHSAEIEYAMGNLSTNEYYDWQEEDYAISRQFLSFYANFCKNGDPNGDGLPAWTAVTKDNLDAAPVMMIDVESRVAASPERENAYRVLEKFYRSR